MYHCSRAFSGSDTEVKLITQQVLITRSNKFTNNLRLDCILVPSLTFCGVLYIIITSCSDTRRNAQRHMWKMSQEVKRVCFDPRFLLITL